MTTKENNMTEPLIPVPPGLAYLPFQHAGICFLATRKASLLGDEMGIGKTIQAIGYLNLRQPNRVLIVCPASLRQNWANELGKWLVTAKKISLPKSKSPFDYQAEIVIINYDILWRFTAEITFWKPDLIIADEAHYIKSLKSRRSKAAMVLPDDCTRIALTGTPIMNWPDEMYSLLKWLDKKQWRNKEAFVKRYCTSVQTRWGMKIVGAKNTDELKRSVSNLMLRRTKADVLPQLPEKRVQVLEIEAEGLEKERDQEMAAFFALDACKVHSGSTESIVPALAQEFIRLKGALATARKNLAIAKLPIIKLHLENVLEQEDKVVCFVHHKDVAFALKSHWPDCAYITGDTPGDRRQEQVNKFQNDPNCRIFVGTIAAAGVGLTLTAASVVVMGEIDWTPGMNEQAIDRLHRIGQKSAVTAQYMVIENSLDARILKRMTAKKTAQEAILNAKDNSNSKLGMP